MTDYITIRTQADLDQLLKQDANGIAYLAGAGVFVVAAGAPKLTR